MRVGFLRIFDLYLWRHSASEMPKKKDVIKKCLHQEAGKICTAIFIFKSPTSKNVNKDKLVYISPTNCSSLFSLGSLSVYSLAIYPDILQHIN